MRQQLAPEAEAGGMRQRFVLEAEAGGCVGGLCWKQKQEAALAVYVGSRSRRLRRRFMLEAEL